jgi:alanine dehydrogenase
VLKLTKLGLDQAVANELPLRLATNISRGKVTNQAVAETFNLNYQPLV